MSYAIYKTEALILRIVPNGEANQDVVFFTRDLGKITVRVQSGRKIESKMRMHITRYNHVIIDVVRGKSVWRLTGIHNMENYPLFKNQGFLHAWHRIVGLAEHLIRGEEAHSELFDFFVGILHEVSPQFAPARTPSFAEPASKKGVSAESEAGVAKNAYSGLELFGVIHVLEKLGYWEGEKLPEVPTEEILIKCVEQKKELVKMINEAIEATQIVV
jgi:hypothetical protein